MKIVKDFIYGLLFALASVAWPGQALAETMYLGYCNGELAETGVGKTGLRGISAAIVYPAEALEEYVGAKVIGLRIGLVTGEGFSDMEAWVRTSLDGGDVRQQAVADPSAGWNEIRFADPYAIDGATDLCFGFTYQQMKSAKCLSIAGDPNANGCWLANGLDWENASSEYDGSLSIDAILEGDGFRLYNLHLEDCRIDSSNVVVYGETLDVTGTVKNLGLRPADGFRLAYMVGGQPEKSVDVVGELASRGRTAFRIPIDTDDVPEGVNIPLGVRVLLADGFEDEDMSDNTASMQFTTYDSDDTFVHYPLFEEFTSEFCINCPSGASRIEQAMRKPLEGGTYADRIIQVCHHSGYRTDWLTIPESEAYEALYNDWKVDGLTGERYLTTYAPACTFDRGQYLRENDTVPVIGVGYVSTLVEQFAYAVDVVALARVVVEADADPAVGTLRVTVDCEKIPAFDGQCPEPHLTVFVIEDSIRSSGQCVQTMIHRHVMRRVLTNVWGDPIDWNGGCTATATYETVLSPDWNAGNLEVVAFISEYTENDASACRVFNAARCNIDGEFGGVWKVLPDSQPVSVVYYDIFGRRVAEPCDGRLYIRVTGHADGRVEVDKVPFFRFGR